MYKYFSAGKSFLKLDLINCVQFMITGVFIWYTIYERDVEANRQKNLILLAPEVFFFLLLLFNNLHGHYLVRVML